MNIGITGSRDFYQPDIKKIYATLRKYVGKGNTWYIGGARGVDDITLQFLLNSGEKCIVVVPFTKEDQPVLCQGYFPKAHKVIELKQSKVEYWEMVRGFDVRNHYIVDRVELLLGFHNGVAGGSLNCIKYANKNKVKTVVTKLRPLENGVD